MGSPPPHAATRASVGMPAKSDGSPVIKLKKSLVETPNRAVYAFFCAISLVGIEAPSIRLKALRLPPSSRIATFSVTPISLAFATAASTIFCASSEEMLCFFTTLAIGLILPLDVLFDVLCASVGRSSRFACVVPGRPNRSVRAVTSVHVEDVTRDEPGFVGRDEHDAVGDLLREAESTQRNLLCQRRLVLRRSGEA